MAALGGCYGTSVMATLWNVALTVAAISSKQWGDDMARAWSASL